MKFNKDTQEKIQELQVLEQNSQALLMQKQAFQLELQETENALKEVEKTKDDVYKITGQIMLKASKEEVEKELKEKSHLLNLRLKSIEKQESSFHERLEKIRHEITNDMEKDKE